MSTENSQPVDTVESSNLHDTAADSGFIFDPDVEEHVVDVKYRRVYVDEIKVGPGGVKRYTDTDGVFGPDDSFECTCGRSFPNEEKAKDHVRKVAREVAINTAPVPEVPTPLTFGTDHYDGDHPFRAELSPCRSAGRVIDGEDYLIATARECFKPPESYLFASWQPLSSGRLTAENVDGADLNGKIFSPILLARAMAYLSDKSPIYDPEKYTIYFRGHEALYIQGPKDGVVVAPRKSE